MGAQPTAISRGWSREVRCYGISLYMPFHRLKATCCPPPAPAHPRKSFCGCVRLRRWTQPFYGTAASHRRSDQAHYLLFGHCTVLFLSLFFKSFVSSFLCVFFCSNF